MVTMTFTPKSDTISSVNAVNLLKFENLGYCVNNVWDAHMDVQTGKKHNAWG